MQHFQLHGLHDIFAFPKPEDQLVAFLHTFGGKSHTMVQIGQFIRPFFPVIPFFQFLQHGYPFLKPHILGLIQLVLKDISAAVIGSYLREILIIFHCLYDFPHLD